MLEAQPLQRIGKFDIDAEIVGIELEVVTFEQRALLVDIIVSVATLPSIVSFQCR